MITKILVVDDESSIREVVCELLEAHGFNVADASCVLQAYDVLCQCPIDIVLSDVMMPEGDGTELKRLMLSDARFKLTPLILMTGHTQKSRQLGGLVLRKPFDVAQLLSVIEHGLG